MTLLDAVRAAVKVALRESTFDAPELEALRFVRSLDRDYQTEARAAVNYVYQTGRAPRALLPVRKARRMLEAS